MGGSELDVLVVGAGVVGLTTALCLAESGLRVGIRTAAPPGASTSATAGAVWGPVMAGPAQRNPGMGPHQPVRAAGSGK